MSDFAQAGLISTFQRLNESHLAEVESELGALGRRIALVLPCHARDFERPALTHIVRELAGAGFLHEIVISLNGLDEARFESYSRDSMFQALPQRIRFLRNEADSGKAGNVAAALAHLTLQGECEIIATQDCDVASFRRADLARLCYAVAHPELGYRFAKAYYSRVTDRLYGRVSRLFVAPLLHACVRVAGHHPLLDFLLSFRYPLAGEVAMTREVAVAMPAGRGWALEIGQLCEVFRRVDPRAVCQVDGGTGYDHKHQPAAPALVEMAAEIARTLFAQLAIEGLPNDAAFHGAVMQAYEQEAAHALRRSAALALMNGVPFDLEAERGIVEAFAAGVR